MKSNRLPSSLIALGLVAVVALGYSQFARRTSTSGSGATGVGSVESVTSAASAPKLLSSAAAPALLKDVCAEAPDRCTCAAYHGAQLLLASFAERALQLVSRAPASCTAPAFLGVRAEALAAVERGEEASKVAAGVLQADPQNRFARRAVAIAAIQNKDWPVADNALTKLVSEDSKDVDSLFYLALSQRKRDHYNGAREGFLHVLRLNAQHVDARYNLVTLTAAAGAAQEAEHDYQELLQIAPVGDSRLIAARAALNRAGNGAAPAELPVVHRAAPNGSVVPPR